MNRANCHSTLLLLLSLTCAGLACSKTSSSAEDAGQPASTDAAVTSVPDAGSTQTPDAASPLPDGGNVMQSDAGGGGNGDAGVGPRGDGGTADQDVLLTLDVQPTNTHLLDWSGGRMLDPMIIRAGAAEVHYCLQHFPAGSQALANLQTALNAYAGLPGVNLHLAVLPQPGTATHPDLSTMVLPANAVYVDYESIAPGAFAATAFGDCSNTLPAPAPLTCSRAHIYANADHYDSDTDPTLSNAAPSVGVFLHELGHVFGEGHINPDDGSVLRDAESLGYDRVTIHGPKFHGNDPRGPTIQAASYALLRAFYADSSPGLDVAEMVAHPLMVRSDAASSTAVEFSADKNFTYGGGRALIDGVNEVKLRWNAGAGFFEPCALPGTVPVWMARHSELSSSSVDQPYQLAFLVSQVAVPTADRWTRVKTSPTLHSHDAAEAAPFRQVEWQVALRLGTAQVGLPTQGPAQVEARQLAFVVDPDGAVAERDESNNRWEVTLCLYPSFQAGTSTPNTCMDACP